MTKTEKLNEQRRLLYKATPSKIKLVDELASLIKGCFGDKVETTGIRFDDSHLKLGGLTVKMVEIDPMKFGGVLVHWYPNFNLSTNNDPFCSAYILNMGEIKKIIRSINKVKEHYQNSLQQK